MFGLGRRKGDEARKLQALTQELEQVQQTLNEQTQRAENAEAQAAFLATQNRALAAKVHRLALQRVELLSDKDRLEKEKRELQISNLQLDNEAHVAKSAKADAWQVPKMKMALSQQAAQHEKKLESMKRRTRALLTAMLPGGQNKSRSSLLVTASSPISDGGKGEVEDIWDAPLTLDAPSTPDVNARVRDIIACLYDDSITEDDALAQMTELTQKLIAGQGSTAATSRGCSPLPVPRLTADDVASATKVDAATDPLTARARHVADVSTETPAEISCIATPRDLSAVPSQGPASPRRPGATVVPLLDLAALVAQAMDGAPLSGRSTTSTSTSTACAPSFCSISQFVLAQPEKLQRLIMRHATATGARPAQPGFDHPRFPQSPYSTLLPPSASATSAAGMSDLYAASSSVSLMDPFAQLSTSGMTHSRPSLTSRLLGMGSGSAANRPAAHQAAVSKHTSGTVSVSGITINPAEVPKRSGAAPPKIVKVDSLEKTAKPLQSAGPVLSMQAARLLTGRGSISSSSGSDLPMPQMDLDSDFKDVSVRSSALGIFQSGAIRR